MNSPEALKSTSYQEGKDGTQLPRSLIGLSDGDFESDALTEVGDCRNVLPATTIPESRVGQVREHNEDPLFADNDRDPWLVADGGIGGHACGEVTSAMAVELLQSDAKVETFTRLRNAIGWAR